MKKQGVWIAAVCAFVMLSFLSGFWYGRSTRGSVQITYTLAPPPSPAPPGAPSPININTADQEALTALPGIGPAVAQRIIEYRQAHGKFRSVQELLNVDGIGTGKLEPILDRITVGG